MSLARYRTLISIFSRALALVVALAFVTGCDTTDVSDYFGPRVVQVSPLNGGTDIPVGTSVSVLFNEAVDYYSITTGSFYMREANAPLVEVPGTFSIGLSSVVFTPDESLQPHSTYTVTLTTGIRDVLYNMMTTSYSWYFTTGKGDGLISTFTNASTVAGQNDFLALEPNLGTGAAGANTLNSPAGGPFIHNSTLYLPDSGNNRVLGFLNLPSVNGASADFVLGQPGFGTALAGNSPMAMNSPSSVFIEDERTFVADTGNNRVLIWDGIPDVTNTPADLALGQSELYANTKGCSAYLMNAPEGVSEGGGKLVVADTLNNRVLIWSGIPGVANTPADLVLGQASLDECGTASSALANTLDAPSGVWTDGARLMVSDTGNNRVLIWRDFPVANRASADAVLGQPDMTTTLPYLSAVDMNAPRGLSLSAGNKLYLADSGNNRVLVWEKFPWEDYVSSDSVLGQKAFYLGTPNDDDGDSVEDATASPRVLNSPGGVHAVANVLVVTDTANNRALIFNTP